ncbi:recombination protein NinB, partial [Enterobacter chengduensis]|uniref:recombination protein NinB n=1 Tax=Enterobacter chengduensis TaxID=2494701 RepID=UPI003D6F7D9D
MHLRFSAFCVTSRRWRMKQHYCIVNDTVKENLIAFIRTIPVNPRAPMVVEAREETRTDKQNRLMWP